MINRYLIITLLLTSTFLYAKDPKIELGVGVFTLSYPDYLGSKSTQLLTAPFPHIRYRGEFLTIDEDGINGKLFGVNGLRLDLSVSGSLPANSEDSKAREGMPDLDFTGEIGPNLVYNMYEHGVALLEFEFPVRAVLSTDLSSIRYRGIVSTPQLKYSLNYSKIEWTLRSGAMFGNKRYHNYFYGVTEEYVTPTRAQYNANSGYSGWRNRIGMTYQKGSLWGGAFFSHFSLNNAVFEDSPLVETKSAVYMGLSMAYIFFTPKIRN